MIKRVSLLLLACTLAATSWGQESKFKFKFYGRIRGDLSYNSRASQESVDGLFYMYPLDEKLDDNGKDLNASAASNFYMLYTRLGVDIAGPKIGKATTTAKVEMDFRGSSTSYALFRMRQAYIQLDWEHHNLLIGQTWHPLTGDITPTMLNLSTGAPFQPFSRTPMLRYRWNSSWGLQATAAAMWQMQYNSVGPDGKSYKYLKNSCVPEVFVGVDYKHDNWTVGIGGEMLSLKPRTESVVRSEKGYGGTYKVNERITSFSAEVHFKYSARMWSVAAKSIFGSNLAHASMLGGYAITSVDETTGECKYTPYRHWSSWVNFVYGKKWQPSVFIGYTSNYGTSKNILGTMTAKGYDIKSSTYGTGLDMDQLMSANVSLSYNLPHWKIGAEFQPTIAWYGKPDNHGLIGYTHSVINYRALAVAMYIF